MGSSCSHTAASDLDNLRVVFPFPHWRCAGLQIPNGCPVSVYFQVALRRVSFGHSQTSWHAACCGSGKVLTSDFLNHSSQHASFCHQLEAKKYQGYLECT